MKIGLLYEPAYWLLLQKLISDLEREIRRVGGQSVRLTPEDLDDTDVDLIYVLPCDELERLKGVEKQRRVINSTQAQEIAIDKIATSRLLIESNLPTPKTIISHDSEPIVNALEELGILLLKFPTLCGGVGHRVLRLSEGQILTTSRHRTYHVHFGERNRIEGQNIVIGPPYYAQEFISGKTKFVNDRVYRTYIVGKQVVMTTARVKADVDTPEKSIINVATGAHYEFLETTDSEIINLSLQVADSIGFETGVVDFLRDASGRPLIIEADCDGCYLFICRKFQEAVAYSEDYNFNGYIVRYLVGDGGP